MLLGDLGQQAQDGQRDQEAVRRRPGTEAERGPQRSALGSRETLEAAQHRRAQLVQPGERELHLRLDPGGAGHSAARGVLDQVVQQRRLANARFAVHHQDPALTRASSFDEPVEHLAFAPPPPELPGGSLEAGGPASARHRHYAAPTPPHDPRLGARCSPISTDAPMGGLGGCTGK